MIAFRSANCLCNKQETRARDGSWLPPTAEEGRCSADSPVLRGPGDKKIAGNDHRAAGPKIKVSA